jgi:hypothetical protein
MTVTAAHRDRALPRPGAAGGEDRASTASASPGGPIRTVPQGWNWVETVARTYAQARRPNPVGAQNWAASLTWWFVSD